MQPRSESLTAWEPFMRMALAEALAAPAHDDVPIGAVAVRDGEVIARRHNERELTGDPTAHAEILVLRDTAAALGTWRLDGVTVVSTLEPCPMCAGALWAARIGACVFGAADMKAGALTSLYGIGADARLNHEFPATGGLLAEECGRPIIEFFEQRRAR